MGAGEGSSWRWTWVELPGRGTRAIGGRADYDQIEHRFEISIGYRQDPIKGGEPR